MFVLIWLACAGDAGFTQRDEDTIIPLDTADDPGGIELDPLELFWDEEAVGGAVVRSFNIESVGEGPLEVVGIVLEEGAEAGFAVPTGGFEFPFKIKPGKVVPVSVVLTRDVHSAATGKVQITTNDSAVPVATLNLVAE